MPPRPTRPYPRTGTCSRCNECFNRGRSAAGLINWHRRQHERVDGENVSEHPPEAPADLGVGVGLDVDTGIARLREALGEPLDVYFPRPFRADEDPCVDPATARICGHE